MYGIIVGSYLYFQEVTEMFERGDSYYKLQSWESKGVVIGCRYMCLLLSWYVSFVLQKVSIRHLDLQKQNCGEK